MFLAIDTVFEQCSVAVVDEELSILGQNTLLGGREQTQQILPMIDKTLKTAGVTLSQLTALIFNRGPGAFSGIRINTAVVQALSVAHDLPCVGVSSLAALAQSANKEYGFEHVYSALDARMKQVYFGEFELSNLNGHKVMIPAVDTEELLVDYDANTEKELPIIGNGANLLSAHSNQQLISEVRPDAQLIATLGVPQFMKMGGVSAEQALPVYLRNNAWKTLEEQGKKV